MARRSGLTDCPWPSRFGGAEKSHGRALKPVLTRLQAATRSYHLISACIAAAPNPADVSPNSICRLHPISSNLHRAAPMRGSQD